VKIATLPLRVDSCRLLEFKRSADELTSSRNPLESVLELVGPVVGLDQAAVAQATSTDTEASIRRPFFNNVISGSKNVRGHGRLAALEDVRVNRAFQLADCTNAARLTAVRIMSICNFCGVRNLCVRETGEHSRRCAIPLDGPAELRDGAATRIARAGVAPTRGNALKACCRSVFWVPSKLSQS
jgi:hypothetical protein